MHQVVLGGAQGLVLRIWRLSFVIYSSIGAYVQLVVVGALHLAEFFWKMVEKSNEVQYEGNPNNCEYLLEKVIITFMAYFRSSGYEEEWEMFADL